MPGPFVLYNVEFINIIIKIYDIKSKRTTK